MLADLTILLHEMSDALRGRGAGRSHARYLDIDPRDTRGFDILVTGLGSAGKATLVGALARQFAGTDIAVRSAPAAGPTNRTVLRVHAETDVEAFVEGGLEVDERRAASAADVVVPVDWEPLARSVARITEALIARGADASRLGV